MTSRRLAAILALDAVGFSARVAADEDGALRALKGALETLETVIGLHRGRVVKTMGDGMLVEFASVVDAVSAADLMQKRLAERNGGLPEAARFLFRIGVHAGEVVTDGDDILGDGVNIAARLESQAPPGGVVVSARVHEDVAGRLDLVFEDLGERSLKNIPKPIRLFAIAAGAAPAAPPPAPSLPDKPSLAVLPFANMSADPEQEYFADGLTEDIITALSCVPWIFVIARNSSFTYKGAAVDVRKVGRELGVRYVLEGSVRRSGPRVRVTGQLIDAETGAHIWADRLDGALEDVFDLQDRMTDSVVAAIAPEIQSAEVERAERKRPENVTAYDHCLRGQAALGRAQVAEGARRLDDAIAAAPDYAKALAVRSWCYTVEIAWVSGRDTAEVRADGLKHALRALEAAPDDPEVAAYSGYTIAFFNQDVDQGMELLRGVVARCPSFAWAWASLGMLESLYGDPQAALDNAGTALRLSPRDPLTFRVRSVMAIALQQLGRFEEALAEVQKGIALNPYPILLHVIRIDCLANLGQPEKAKAAAARLMEISPGFRVSRWLSHMANFGNDRMIGTIEASMRAAGVPE